MLSFRTYLIATLTILLVSGCVVFSANAQNRTSGDEIVEFLRSASAESVTFEESPEAPPSPALMTQITEAVMSSDSNALRRIVADADASVVSPDERGDFERIINFGRLILNESEHSLGSGNNASLIQALISIPDQEGWYIQTTALQMAGFLNLMENRSLIAANLFSEANRLIPEELSYRVSDAQLRSSEMTAVLHATQANTEFLFEAAKKEVTIKTSMGRPIDVREFAANFIYALNANRNYSDAAIVGEYLQEIDHLPTSIPGLAEAYYAQALSELEQFRRSETVSRNALQLLDTPVLTARVQATLIVALSGQGRVSEAESLLQMMDWKYSEEELLSETGRFASSASHFVRSEILYAESLLAADRGDVGTSLALMKRRSNMSVKQVFRSSSTNMASMLANLQNSRERQLEREANLEREAELKATQLEQQQQLNYLLMSLLSMTVVGLFTLVMFIRYRAKLNRKVRKLSEEALSAEKMKTEFLGIINHELRTPLNGIIGLSDAMIHHTKDPAVRQQAEVIQESGQKLFEMIASLIDMSTLEGNRLSLDEKPVSLDDIISEEANKWDAEAAKKNLAFTHFVAPELSLPVLGDSRRIQQCVHVLLSNALRFTHEGRVHLHATSEINDGRLSAKIIVADTGQGMAESVQERLFKPFLQADSTMTRKYGGVGLNLAIARSLARMMDGDLTVISRQDRGSEFTLTLTLPLETASEIEPETQTTFVEDVSKAESSEIAESFLLDDGLEDEILDLMNVDSGLTLSNSMLDETQKDPTDLTGLSALVVEDEPSNQTVIQLLLKSEELDCMDVSSGHEALDVLRVRNVDFVIMDVHMPDMDGLETTRRIRALPGPASRVPIIVLTSDAQDQVRKTAAHAGADRFLTKPVTTRTLIQAMREVRVERAENGLAA